MSESEIPAEVRRAYGFAQGFMGTGGKLTGYNAKQLADALRDERARANRAQFYQEHHPLKQFCSGGGYKKEFGMTVIVECSDPRHNWTLADWQAAAHKELTGEIKG